MAGLSDRSGKHSGGSMSTHPTGTRLLTVSAADVAKGNAGRHEVGELSLPLALSPVRPGASPVGTLVAGFRTQAFHAGGR
jgi:hypothetical protein